MAFDPKPSSWIASWTEDGTSVTFDMADMLQVLSAVEADALTGDWRDCFYSFLDHSYQYYDALPEADKPVQVTIQRVTQKYTDSILKFIYTVEVFASVASTDVTAE